MSKTTKQQLEYYNVINDRFCILENSFPDTLENAKRIFKKQFDFYKQSSKSEIDYKFIYYLRLTEKILNNNGFGNNWGQYFNNLRLNKKFTSTIYVENVNNSWLQGYLNSNQVLGMNGWLPVFKNQFQYKYIFTCQNCGANGPLDFNDCCKKTKIQLTHLYLTMPIDTVEKHQEVIIHNITKKLDNFFFKPKTIKIIAKSFGSKSPTYKKHIACCKRTWNIIQDLKKGYKSDSNYVSELIDEYNKNGGYSLINERINTGGIKKNLRYNDTKKTDTIYTLAVYLSVKKNDDFYNIPSYKSLQKTYR